ncbi:polymorphic toxin type 15 domain-containing protein [Tritonibacter scottomollicae]|uniref:Putative RNase toxin 15 of polymorphic toxin system n=1 Tax=Tritonibacter scottomollicae TaxID=483013 RepID=A0A2T0ZWX4_TRISK|nr:polymorphic toxin type 15 domain-containing protein [Tritonibacter scottomollicae]PRZ40833.1 putative RNase toxin 15 of polymorphic toxin system [Tritonibacter scottomollicae]
MAETAQEKFLREKQEYEDALAAYRNVLGRAAGTVQIPYAMQSSYAVENQGYERAATDPWITERFPDLQAAAERVQAEEQQFLALDDPFPSHANSQCSIANYTALKVYEYYALFETVYLLATDAAFRDQVVAQIEAFLTGSGLDHYMAANNLQNQADILMLGKPDLLDYWLSDDAGDEVLRQREQEIDQQLEVIGQQTAFHMSVVEGKIAEFFTAVWQDLKQKYYDCGILYAVSTVGVDGIFVAAEIYSGLAFLRFLKFGLRALPNTGQIAVDILDGNGRKIVDRTHSQAALAAKYGEPQENGVGGFAPDTNRDIPDSPAEKVLEQQPRDRESGNNDNDEPERPNHPRGPRREVDCFDVPRNVDRAEFDRQLREQQDTINNMTADEMGYAHAVLDHAREVWRDTGQKGSFTKLLRGNGEAQRQARTKHREYLDKALGLDEDEIDELMADLDATHFLDIIAGGDPEHVGMGGAQENQRIGPAWTYKNTPSGASRAGQLKDYSDQLRTAGRSDHLMNVGLSSCD